MGKSSSSLKKKRSKKSSKDQTSSKSKSRKYKSKKLRRREVDLSSSDYDNSESMSTSLSFSSDDSYGRRRARSRMRKDAKGHRKKAQRRSYSRDSSEGSPRVRKRRRSKRKNDNKVREKPHGKKKRRREASASSTSGRSWSCSTCQVGDSGSEFERYRGRSERKEKDKRRLQRGRSESVRRGRYRARSCSSCSRSSESSDERTREKYMSENNSRRLKSVITVTKGAEDGGELFRNEGKEEIVDDHDYPSRSNDSNDGGGKRDPSSEEKVSFEDEKGDEYADFSKKSCQNSCTDLKIRDKSYDDTRPYGRSNVYVDRTSESMEKKTSDVSEGSLDGDDLEAILRQRAIENLRKFRGDVKLTSKVSDQKNEIGSNLKQQPFTDKHELVQGKFLANNEAVGANVGNLIEGTSSPMERRDSVPSSSEAVGANVGNLVEGTSSPMERRPSIPSSRNNGRILNGTKGKPGPAKHHSSCASEKVMDLDNPSETVMASDSYRTKKSEFNSPEAPYHLMKTRPSLEQRFASDVKNIAGLCSAVPKQFSCTLPTLRDNNLIIGKDEDKEHSQFELKQTSASREPSNTKSVVMEGDVDKDAAKTAQAVTQIVHNNARNPEKLCDSATLKPCDKSNTGEDSSNKLQDEANQRSQFEQKTMNVMRGGEMVQVSYKVYIPKKAPALARRQLKG